MKLAIKAAGHNLNKGGALAHEHVVDQARTMTANLHHRVTERLEWGKIRGRDLEPLAQRKLQGSYLAIVSNTCRNDSDIAQKNYTRNSSKCSQPRGFSTPQTRLVAVTTYRHVSS